MSMSTNRCRSLTLTNRCRRTKGGWRHLVVANVKMFHQFAESSPLASAYFITRSHYNPSSTYMCTPSATSTRVLPWSTSGEKLSCSSTYIWYTIHMYSGITSGRVLDGELLYAKILEVHLFAFAYRLFHRDMSRWLGRNLYETVCRQMQTN